MVCARLMPVTRMTPRLIGTSMLVRIRRSAAAAEAKNGRPGIGDGRHGDQRGDPVQQVARGGAHVVQQAADLAGPDADRQQHHVDRGEAGDREGSDQGAIGAVARGGERRRVEWHQAVAETFDRIDQRCGAFGGAAPCQAQAARGHVDAAGQHVGFAREDRLDQPDAGAALQAVDRQDEFVRAVGRGWR